MVWCKGQLQRRTDELDGKKEKRGKRNEDSGGKDRTGGRGNGRTETKEAQQDKAGSAIRRPCGEGGAARGDDDKAQQLISGAKRPRGATRNGQTARHDGTRDVHMPVVGAAAKKLSGRHNDNDAGFETAGRLQGKNSRTRRIGACWVLGPTRYIPFVSSRDAPRCMTAAMSKREFR